MRYSFVMWCQKMIHIKKYFVMGSERMQVKVIHITMSLALLLLIRHCSAAQALEHKCIHDTEEMQTLIYGPVVDVKTGQRHAFTPQGILERTVPQHYRPVPPPDAPDEVHRAFHATAVGNIRIVTSTEDLNDNTKYCSNASQTVPNFKGKQVKCTAADVFTDKKKEILLNKVLPAALDKLSSALKVNQVEGNLISSGCDHYTVPKSHSTTGLSNADYVLYVSAAPTNQGTVAWAGICLTDSVRRPVAGRVNLSPQHLVWNDDDTVAQRQLVQSAIHEILHALGFIPKFLKSNYVSGDPYKYETRRGKTITYLTSENVVKKAREHFNCPTLSGPELENEGGVGTQGSHWERRNHKDDIMAGTGDTCRYLSPITLAFLEDTGHYIIDWSKAENPKWMYKAGCGVIYEKCKTKEGGLGKYFCNDGNTQTCSSDHRGIGKCDIMPYYADLPYWADCYPGNPPKCGTSLYMDYCPIVTTNPNRQCDNPVNTDGNSTTIPQYYANDGRCFNTIEVIQDGHEASILYPASCLQTRCVRNAVEFKMPNNETWISCPSEGAQVTLLQYGYKGTVICPDPNIICDVVESNVPGITPTKNESSITKPSETPPAEGTPAIEPDKPVAESPTKETPATEPDKPVAESPTKETPATEPDKPVVESPTKETPATEPDKPVAESPTKETPATEPDKPVVESPTKETPATEPDKPVAESPTKETPATEPNKPVAESPTKETPATELNKPVTKPPSEATVRPPADPTLTSGNKSTVGTTKSGTAISSTIVGTLLTCVVFLYLSHS